MNERRAIPRPGGTGQASVTPPSGPDRHWRVRHLLLAPHRLGFFLAMVVLASAGGWWALVQFSRVNAVPVLPYAVSPSLVHAAVMTFGFIPLFFSGFLFTAGPKWLGVQALEARQLQVPLLLQATGWLVWVAGGHLAAPLAVAGVLMAWAGLSWVTWRFWWLIRRSEAEDRLHALTIGTACLVGCLSLAGLVGGLLWDAPAVARASVLTGLWGFVVVVYVSVAHRMIPFFTSSALPFITAWRPFWVLWLMLGAAAMEVLAVWVELGGPLRGSAANVWALVRGIFELAAGMVLLWLAWTWGLVQSLRNRLLAMLHIGFVWLGLAFTLGGAAQWLGLWRGAPVLALGSLHALTMGCLASLMLAMVTRVSCGHSGRALVADGIAWSLFWLLQGAVVLRIAAAALPSYAGALLLLTALLWGGLMTVWAVRLGGWYGRLRADGRPG